ncbi:hypothetical protein EV586_11612 [Tumebacillus sp. BK434]|nr:hypothetical protein [Tumebacillus sp. BK434]TCP52130.1 hypothetical protein EV586_11612 [Tumebacillus sp. BK434]
MKKFWLSLAVVAAAALAAQTGSAQVADPGPIDPWVNISASY